MVARWRSVDGGGAPVLGDGRWQLLHWGKRWIMMEGHTEVGVAGGWMSFWMGGNGGDISIEF
jgi:hypothetical protein